MTSYMKANVEDSYSDRDRMHFKLCHMQLSAISQYTHIYNSVVTDKKTVVHPKLTNHLKI